MKTELNKIKIADLFNGYENRREEGVWAYDGKLNVRPPYQREFVYNDKQQKAVINSIINDFPLNVMYWVVKDNGIYELLDGQQRTLSICQFLDNEFSIKDGDHNRSWHQLKNTELGKQILNYELYVYHCTGDSKEIVDWFDVINTAGEKLNKQEILNAVYSSKWLTDARKKFSKQGCPAYQIGKDYLKGSAIKQQYLEAVLKWVSNNEVERYLNDKLTAEGDASDLWEYFEDIINWVKDVFKVTRPQMKGVDWGHLHKNFGDEYHSSDKIERELMALLTNEDINNNSKIYTYIFTGDKRDLQFRTFKESEKLRVYEKQGNKCACGQEFKFEDLEGDHVVAWSKGGETIESNLQLLCKPCNGRKSNK